jgi:hypothetical protein
VTAYISIEGWISSDALSSAEICVYYTEENGPPMIDLNYEFSAGIRAGDARTLAAKLVEAADKAEKEET